MDLQRIGIKVFLQSEVPPDPTLLISVFHSWIQEQLFPEHLLVDVHDYRHVFQGPGILLVAHEGNFSMDQADGLPGLLYHRKQPQEGSLKDRLRRVFRAALTACRKLEKSSELDQIQFRTDRILLISNDRLEAPAAQETFERLQPSLEGLLKPLLGPEEVYLIPQLDPRERLTVIVESRNPLDVSTLLNRFSGEEP